MRFQFIDAKNDDSCSNCDKHYLVLWYCRDCIRPKDFLGSRMYPNSVYHLNSQCFQCGVGFDGNTSAYELILGLDDLNFDRKGNKI